MPGMRALLALAVALRCAGSSTAAEKGPCLPSVLAAGCARAELTSVPACEACARRFECIGDSDVVGACREAVAAAVSDPQDPPFDTAKVLFSGTFTDNAVLQRAPRSAAVYGTAAPGATVSVTLTGPGGFVHKSAPAAVATSADPTVHGTWKVVLPPRPAGFGYTVTATCTGCANATSAVLDGVGFGDVFLCSGQSNMEDPVLTTLSRNSSYDEAANGTYDHIRLFQMGYRMNRTSPTWILPQTAAYDDGGYPNQKWQVPSGCPDHGPDPTTCSLQRFSAVCWYFGKSLSDRMAAAASEAGESDAEPVPIGLIHSSIGGTTIQQWMPPSTTTNATCKDNNCGYSVAMNTSLPKCTNASISNVWSCPSAHCSDLWHGMICPFVNTTLLGAVWYQGEQNVFFGEGSVLNKSGYACQQAAMIASWREAFSAVKGTSDRDFLFGVTTLAGGCSEAFPLWSPYQHFSHAEWETCATDSNGVNSRTSPTCIDMKNDWAGGLRVAQTGGYGHTPNPALPNVFLGQAFDHGEPCSCDRRAQAPGGCWANGQCYGWTSPYSLNRTWNYQNSGIHPRPKLTVGMRLARAAFGLMQTPPRPQPVPKLAGCRLEAGGSRIVLSFDSSLLGGEQVALQPPGPGKIPLELRVGPGIPTGPHNTSGWVFAKSLELVNATAVAVTVPPGSPTPTALRYAWADSPCCPGLEATTAFCPPAACPIVTASTKEPAVPFWAYIQGGRCVCDAPWDCSA